MLILLLVRLFVTEYSCVQHVYNLYCFYTVCRAVALTTLVVQSGALIPELKYLYWPTCFFFWAPE